MWIRFCELFTLVGLIWLATRSLPLPFFDRSGATLIGVSRASQIATARALAVAIGSPLAQLDTPDVRRFLFRDGTSVDHLVHAPHFVLSYRIVALKSIVIGFFSGQRPLHVANRICEALRNEGHDCEIIDHPDTSFAAGRAVILVSSAFCGDDGAGFGLIVRKHGLKMGGPRPRLMRRSFPRG